MILQCMYRVVEQERESGEHTYETQHSVETHECDSHTIQNIENIVQVIHNCITKH